MNISNTPALGIAILSASIFLAACGPSQDSLNATATQIAAWAFMTQTAAAPTATHTPAPTSTATPTLTPTPTPPPSAQAMLRWQELALPAAFLPFPPENLGIEEGALAYSLTSDGKTLDHPIAGSFLFADEESMVYVYGYTTLLGTGVRVGGFQWILENFRDWIGGDFAEYPEYEFSDIDNLETIGDESRGASVTYEYDGVLWRMDEVAFRVGGIGAFTFLRRPEGVSPGVDIGQLASAHAASILNPPPACHFVSVEPIEGVPWPEYHFLAEGFYPNEGRMVILSGDAMVDGSPQGMSNILAGGGGESADGEGRVEGQIDFPIVVGKNVSPPARLTISVQGFASGCEATEEVSWPAP
jgi:hypothetical protein